MKSLLTSFKSIKAALVLAASLFSVANAEALTLTAESTSECVGSPVILTAGETTDGHYYMLQKKLDSGAWTDALTGPTKGTSYAVDMETVSSAMYFRLVDKGTSGSSTLSTSSEVTVSLQTSDCPIACQQTSTGDYFSGTDFNTKTGVSESSATIPDGVVSFFDNYNVIFENGGISSYNITSNVKSFLGINPKVDADSLASNSNYSNYYYTITNPNNYPFTLRYYGNRPEIAKNLRNDGKYYRFTMRLYIKRTCDIVGDGGIKFSTGHGCATQDYLDVKIYNDRTGELLGSDDRKGCDMKMTFLSVAPTINSVDDLIRVEATFYGQFPFYSNGYQYSQFTFTPRFEQMGCAKIAVDFISSEIESVCMDHGTVCIGTATAINAAGFPHNAVYVWEMVDKYGNFIAELENTRGKQKISIKPTAVGVKYYRVRDANTEAAVYFQVVGKDCNPSMPESITGPDQICAPVDEDADYLVTPADASPNVYYGWTLKKKASSDVLYSIGSGSTDATRNTSVLYATDASDTHFKAVSLKLPDDVDEGTYVLTVQLYKEGLANGDPVSKEINVYQKPNPVMSITEPICPFTDNLVTITPYNPDKYGYNFGWYNKSTSTPNVGVVVMPTDYCSLSTLLQAAQMYVKDMPSCYKDVVNYAVKVNNSKPEIDCSALQSAIKTLGYNDITLGATEGTVTLTLPLPTITSTCDPNPLITITGSGTDVEGNAISYSLIKKKDAITTADLTITLPATTNATGTNGVTFLYGATDGCDRSADPCTFKIIVRDVTGPNVDCDKITSYDNVHLSNQRACTAVPGYYEAELPTLKVPDLTDLNGVDTKFTTTYVGRLANPTSAASTTEGLYDHDIDLNDPYVAGTTYILWKFTDAAGNSTYCIQHVGVINDKQPEVTCPSSDYGKFSVDDNCQLSFDELFTKLPKASLPTAYDPCPNGSEEYNVESARLFYREGTTGDWTEIVASMYTEDLFKLNKSYQLQWRYYKQGESAGVDKTVYGECVASLEIVDSVPPVVDCSALISKAVPYNSNSKGYREFEYASAQLPSTETKDTRTEKDSHNVYDYYNNYSLEGVFSDIPVATDACGETINPVVTIQGPKETVATELTGTNAEILEQLNDRKFTEGNTVITYTYTDKSGNVSSCDQTITVYSGLYVDCAPDVTLYADKDCNGVYDVAPADLNTALVSFVREFKRKNYQNGDGSWCKYCTPKLVTTDAEFETLPTSSDSMAAEYANKKVYVYPYKVEKITNVTAAGEATASSVTTTLTNTSTKSDVPQKVVGHMYYSNSNHAFLLLKNSDNTANTNAWQIYKKVSLQTSSFESIPTDFKTFPKGTHKLVWYYDDGQGTASSIKSCTTIITVKDNTPPTVTCGDWGKTDLVRYADDNCVSTDVLPVPTPTQLNAEDNCTTGDANYKITYKRDYYKKYSALASPTEADQEISDPYKLGTTIIVWTIADADGNKTTCKNQIEVLDTIAPKFDCSTLKDIVVDADPMDQNCRIEASEVMKQGLSTPKVVNDKCSPVSDASGNITDYIYATGVREGNEDVSIFSDYYSGETTIIWTFKDAGLGVKTCKQKVIVNDNDGPVLDCSDLETPIKHQLKSDACTVDKSEITLVKPIAKDNCTPDDELVFTNNAPSEYKIGTTKVTWTVTDSKGNSNTCPQNVIVIDTAIPKGSCPPDIEKDATVGSCSLEIAIDPDDYAIDDPCDGKLTPAFVVRSDEKKLSAAFKVGETTIEWLYTDNSGNEKRCFQTVTVHDKTAPVVDCSNSATLVEIPTDPGECEVPVALVVNAINTPTATDACQDEDPIMTGERYYKGLDGKSTPTLVVDSKNTAVAWNDGSVPYQPGYYTIKFVFTDKEGNVSDPCEQELFIKNINAPVITCSKFVSDKTFSPDEDKCDTKITLVDLGATSVKATEYCDDQTKISGTAYLYIDGLRGTKPFESTIVSSGESATIHWVFTSQYGIETVCPQVVTVKDDQAPKCTNNTVTISTAADATVCYADADIKLADINATDNCGTIAKYEYKLDTDEDYTEIQKDSTFEQLAVGTHTLTWQLTDKFDLSAPAACKTTIVVKDATPAICEDSELDDVPTLATDTKCEADVELPLAKNATDNCPANTIKYRYKVDDSGSYTDITKTTTLTLPVGAHTIYWELSDGFNTNAEACKTTVTVVDKTAPTCTDKDMGEIKSDETDCSVNAQITLADIAATDNCDKTITYKYSLDGATDSVAMKADTKLKLAVGAHTITWQISDGTNVRNDACKTTVTVLDNRPLVLDCDDIKEKTFKTDDCGPVDISSIDIPEATDPCATGKIKGTPDIDLTKALTLGDHEIVWSFVNMDGLQPKTCTQTIHVVTTQELITDCESPTDPIALKDGECLATYALTQRTATNPCDSKEVIKGDAYAFGALVDPSKYATMQFPAGSWTVTWKFKSTSNTLAEPETECTETIVVNDENGATLPCKDGYKVEKTIDACEIDAAKLDFGNTSVIADEICQEGKTVTPSIWIDTEEGVDPVKVDDPTKLGTFKPGTYNITWEYIFHPSGLGELKAYCHQPIEIKTDKKIVTNCDADNFKDINVYADATCQVPASEVKFAPANATNPCDASVVLKPQAYLGTEKVTDNVFTAPFPKGTTVVTWKYTDPTGTLTVSEAECTQNVVVTDTTKPEVTCEADKDYYLGRDADGKQNECEAAAGVIDLQRPTVSDNCSSDASDFKFWLKRELNGEEVDSTAAFKVGTTNVTWTVMDKDGNKQTCTMKVVVNDTVTPKLDCPADMLDLQAKEGECGVIIDDIVPTGIKDACDANLIVPVGTRDDGLALTDSFPTGKTTVITWIYTDSIGNQTTCKQNIFVKDVTKPEVDCSNTANPINVETELGQCEVPSSVVVDNIKLPTAKDKCQTEAPVMTSNRWYLGRAGDSIPTRQLVGGEDIAWNDDVPFKAGYYQIHFIFTDLAGNADSCSQVVFVKDGNPPYLNDCKDVTDKVLNPADGECDAPIVPLDLNSYKGHEVCTGVEIPGVPSLLVKEGDDFVVSADAIPATVSSGDSIYIRWTYTSQMGVSAYCDQKIKVVDNQKPTIDCDVLTPQITLTADADKCEISAANADIKYPTVEDNCGTITGRPVRIDTLTDEPNGLTMDDPYPTGKSVIRWYFEDTNDENTQYCDQVVFVKGSVNPEIDCDTIEGKVLVDTINTCDITEQTLKVVAPVAIDKCAPTDALKSVTGVGSRSDGKAIDDLYPLGITTITWTFTDFTGNASTTCTQKVNIVTRQKMIMDCADTVATYDLEEDECLKAITLDQRTAKHPCPDAVDADKQVIKGVAYLNGSLEALTSLDIKLPQGSHVITWVFTDDTHTLANPVDTCYDSIKVGNNNVPPVPCVNDNIDITLNDVCEISAAEVQLNNTGVEAPQLCGDEGEMVAPSIWRTSNPTKVVNTPADLDAFTTGKDTVIWKYDFNPGHLGIYTVYCKQAIDVKTTKEIELACPDSAANTIEIVAPAGLCEVPADTITLNPLVGKNPCIDTVFIHGVPDRDTTLAWPLGVTTITWTYTDTTNTLTNPTATCKQYVSVKDTVNPEIDCETLYNDVKLTTKVCELSVDDLGLKGQPVTQCEFVMDPVPTRFSGKDFNDPYVIGNDTVYWTYTYEHNGKSTVCPQAIILRDTAPVFDCKQLKDTTLTADDEECVINKSLAEVLDALEPYPTAVDPCDASYTIKGTYKLADVDTLPTQLTAGDTLHVVWSFADTTRSADTTTCDQLVIIKGNATPEINCEEATPALKDTIDDCGPDHELLVSVPKAFDKCFGDSIPGSFVRSDGAAKLDDPFALGDTYITWTFWNIDSTKSTTCEQNIHIYTNSEIIKPCDTAALAPIVVAAPEDACTVDASDVDIPRQYALNPCNGDTIWGVMSRPNAASIDAPYNIGKNLIVWTFTDTTNTLVKSVDTCRQYVNVGSVEVEPVSCDSFPAIEKILAEGNCTIDAAELGIKAPTIIDRCPNGSADAGPVEVLPVITRYTKPGWSSSQASEIEEFGVGVDTLWWSYPRFETVCAQPIHILDSVAPKFDCDDLQPIVAVAPDGKCELNVDSVLVKPYPVAHEACTDSAIVGVPTLLNGDPLPETLNVGDSIVVLWTFELPELSTKAKTCEQPIRAMGTATPQFDCESLKVLEFVTDGCDINLDKDSIDTPVATDSCTGKEIPGVGVRADGGDLYGTYPLGKTSITWTFTSPDSKTSKSCEQIVEVKTSQVIDAKCGEENYPSLSYEVKDGACTVPADSVDLTAHEAYNPCNTDIKISGVATRSDSLAITEAFPIGTTTITWTFTDTTNTLVTPSSSCTQTVTVVDHNIPDPDCETSFPAVRLVLDDEDCDLDFSKIPVYINHIPTNPCSGELAMIDTSRTSGKGVHDPYTVGTDTLVWKFWYPTNNIEVFCYQKITVADTIAPAFDCSTLADTIEVEIMTEGNTVTFEEVKAKGFYIPEVTDKCTEVFTEVTRSDSKELEDDYMLGNTDVTFRFSDAYGNDTVCMQTIKVVDMIPPKVICPPLENTLSCADDTTPAYKTFEEFKAAGGSVDPESKADLFSFRHEDTREGDECNAVITREYFLTSINNVNVHCESAQHFYVKDSIAPVYSGIPTNGFSINSSCDNPHDEPLDVTATDNCDPEPVVSYERVSTQGSDPSKCDYYTYDVTYTYKAVDRCGNAAEPVVYTIHVKDTVAPNIHKPHNWDDVMYPVYMKNCEFGVPDITGSIPSDSIEQNCGDNQYLSIWQEPAAGTKVETTTIVKLHIVDVCGNDQVMEKTLRIQAKEDIIKLTVKDHPVCGTDDAWSNPVMADNSVTNIRIANALGHIAVYDEALEVWDTTVPSNIFMDYYRDSISIASLVYSNNPVTYQSRYPDVNLYSVSGRAAYAKYVLLTRRTQSGEYWFVAMDTVSGCTDTAHVYIDVRERPRIALESGQWNICEGDSLSINGEFGDTFAPCVEDMGAAITAEGWMVNDSVYNPLDSVNYDNGIAHTAAYYATNVCGTTTSLNSFYTSCAGDLPTRADSLAFAGSQARLVEMQNDSLYVSDSVKVNVYTHYDPTQVLLTTDPQDKARIWIGDEADLVVSMPYEEPSVYKWMHVIGDYDAEQGAVFNKYGDIIANGSGESDDEEIKYSWAADDSMHYTIENTMTVMPTDTSFYYVVVGNGVCPTVSSNLVSIDLLDKLPTAITPYTKDGMNDDFVRGHHVVIFNRYGQQVFEGNDGWDGTYRGLLADPGVYFYTVDMAGGVVLKGSVEVVKIK